MDPAVLAPVAHIDPLVAALLVLALNALAELWTQRLEELTAGARDVDPADPVASERARRALIGGLARLAEAVRGADSEWWSHRVDEARVVTAQREAHRALAGLARPD